MKNLLISLFLVVLSLITISCHNTDGVIPREPFVGIYSVSGKQRLIGANGKLISITDISDQVTVSLVPKSNRIKLSSANYPDLEAALVNKNSFKISDQLFPDQTGSRYGKIYTGTGVVTGNQLLLSIDVDVYTDQVSTITRILTHVEGDRQ